MATPTVLLEVWTKVSLPPPPMMEVMPAARALASRVTLLPAVRESMAMLLIAPKASFRFVAVPTWRVLEPVPPSIVSAESCAAVATEIMSPPAPPSM